MGVVAGLLHHTVEDTNLVIFKRLETKVSKLGKLKYKNENGSVQDVKAEDLQQMFMAMTEEANIARETLQVFAPLAKLLGKYEV
ncbi:GTP diphosphokinase rsh1 chloroplastic [Stylosanthes scabra]|uniref:GTP diphosphokinase rsh1 chloroplastic n=1 Tax=Stylosanthes scabra TaxID=79078 RepID=A0ABU6ZG10_9FABA|nr:GTP diphosphokinase rsh1 chloroplastic [Stylosanthes scabra]